MEIDMVKSIEESGNKWARSAKLRLSLGKDETEPSFLSEDPEPIKTVTDGKITLQLLGYKMVTGEQVFKVIGLAKGEPFRKYYGTRINKEIAKQLFHRVEKKLFS